MTFRQRELGRSTPDTHVPCGPQQTPRWGRLGRHRVTGAATALAVAMLAAISPAPGVAATKRCGAVAGVGNGTKVTNVTASSGTCGVNKTLAKSFARTRVAPNGYRCKETFVATTTANVRCARAGRTITFRVAWTRAMPLPAAPAPPITNSG